MKQILFTLLAAITLSGAAQSQIITLWNFNGESATTVPGGTESPTPSLGTGTASLLGGVSATFASGAANGGSTDPVTTSPPNYGWQTTTYAAQSAESGLRGVRFDVSTVGYDASAFDELVVKFDLRTSGTSSRWYQVDYTVNGTSWILGTPTELGTGTITDTWARNRTFSITDAAAFDNAAFGFRVVSVFAPSTSAYAPANTTGSYAAGGTWRFDMVSVQAVPEPASFLAIAAGSALLLMRRRRRSA
jgi:hypothetical protein